MSSEPFAALLGMNRCMGLIPRTFVVRHREPCAIDVGIAILST